MIDPLSDDYDQAEPSTSETGPAPKYRAADFPRMDMTNPSQESLFSRLEPDLARNGAAFDHGLVVGQDAPGHERLDGLAEVVVVLFEQCPIHLVPRSPFPVRCVPVAFPVSTCAPARMYPCPRRPTAAS